LLFGMGHLISGMGLSLFGTRGRPDRQMLRRVILLRQLVLCTINTIGTSTPQKRISSSP